jgi:hypothetical protein
VVAVRNGAMAERIRKGVEPFLKAIYQVDTFHLVRELRYIFGYGSPVVEELMKDRQMSVMRYSWPSWLKRALARPLKRNGGAA